MDEWVDATVNDRSRFVVQYLIDGALGIVWVLLGRNGNGGEIGLADKRPSAHDLTALTNRSVIISTTSFVPGLVV